MPVIKNKFSDFLMPRKNIWAITLYPFIFVRRGKKITKRLIAHERIHLRQQAEMLVIPFYIWYLIEMLVRIVANGSVEAGYRKISFEREAYANDGDSTYLRRRGFWAFFKYL